MGTEPQVYYVAADHTGIHQDHAGDYRKTQEKYVRVETHRRTQERA
jgi:hypothetical protein